MEWSFDTCDPARAGDVRRELLGFLGRHSRPGSPLVVAELAFDELVGNACRYAPGPVWVHLDWSRCQPVLHVRDAGAGFDLAEAMGSDVRGGLRMLADLAGPVEQAQHGAGGTDVSVTLPVPRTEDVPPVVMPGTPALPAPEDADSDGAFSTDALLRALVVQLAQSIEHTHGPAAAQGAMSAVGARVGERVEQEYRRARALTDPLSPSQLADLFRTLRAAVGGDLSVTSVRDDQIVLSTRRCPFGDVVRQAPSLCHLTSQVLTGIAARNTGDADVRLEQRMAAGHRECRAVVALGDRRPQDADPDGDEQPAASDRLRAVLAEDTLFLRDALVRLLADAGVDVVAQCSTGRGLLGHVRTYRPDVAIVDLRADETDDALTVARQLRQQHPGTGVLVLAETIAPDRARELLEADGPGGVGYLLKDRLEDLGRFLDAVRSVAAGGVELDPQVLSEVACRRPADDPLATLTPRELQVLAEIARGLSNDAIAEQLVISKRAIEKHVSSIFLKLDLPPTTEQERRVVAAMAYRDATEGRRGSTRATDPRLAGP